MTTVSSTSNKPIGYSLPADRATRADRGRKLRERDPFANLRGVGKKLATRVLVGPAGPELAPNFDDQAVQANLLLR